MGRSSPSVKTDNLSKEQVQEVEDLFERLTLQLGRSSRTQERLLTQQAALNRRSQNVATQNLLRQNRLSERLLSTQRVQQRQAQRQSVLDAIIGSEAQQAADNYSQNQQSRAKSDMSKAALTQQLGQRSLISILSRNK